ncbi:hypothetical protein C8T65DRAFT_643678 [Cerioporus squamosus]|nr:hypothetical protein C8T65DRAFT_643678 [Cerioporus squamosus]
MPLPSLQHTRPPNLPLQLVLVFALNIRAQSEVCLYMCPQEYDYCLLSTEEILSPCSVCHTPIRWERTVGPHRQYRYTTIVQTKSTGPSLGERTIAPAWNALSLQ